jgi:hypothetical protein
MGETCDDQRVRGHSCRSICRAGSRGLRHEEGIIGHGVVLVVNEVMGPDDLGAALLGRLRASVGWRRATPGRRHPVSPV